MRDKMTKEEIMRRMDFLEDRLGSGSLSLNKTREYSREFNQLLDGLAASTYEDEAKDEFIVEIGKVGRAEAPVHTMLDESTLEQLRALATA
jgi:hypothetical protein